MPVTRLNEGHRNFLKDLAFKAVRCPDLEAIADKAYAKAAPVVRKLVEAKYPAKDMKLLAKYECATPDRCIRFQLTAGGIVEFCFRQDDTPPLRPDRYSCKSIYAADDVATEAISASISAIVKLTAGLEKKRDDYRALIRHSVTLEQVETVWPAASALRERVGRTLPVVLSEDVIARIKADNASLAEAA